MNETEERIDKIEIKEKNIENNTEIKFDKIVAYFAIYSFFGFLIETIYGLLTKGVIESRQSFLYGPFCGIYGLGAIIMICGLQYFKKNNYTLFFGGYIIGSVIEYIVSLCGEIILNVKWWDYSNEPFNINGRVCLSYSIFWGVLAIYLIKNLNPLVEKIIEIIKKKFSQNWLPIFFNFVTAFLIGDCIISAIAVNVFYSRLVHNFDLDIHNAEFYNMVYEERVKNPRWFNFTEKYFSNEKMLKTYPNLKLQDKNGKIIFVKDLLNDIKPYYFKFFNSEDSTFRLTNVESVTFEE